MQDTDEITIGANGSVYVAPVGTSVPANVGTALGAGWVDLGLTSEDGVSITDSKTLGVTKAWQLFYAARRFVTDRDLMVAFTLIQFAGVQVELAFGGSVEETSSGFYKLTPPDPEEIDERALVVEWQDGDKSYRFHVVRGIVTENVETKIARTQEQQLPITFGIVGEAGVAPWALYTDDPAFEAATGS